ncbi:GspH/FimT family pseudopilin [Nocardioides bruguierae]|uniref:GspH/FimT family pseudopilin n=1 Tax=Nocardioides bruguierae TaxID=2945102 RepID=A0A9X2IGU0_9ACTN|nr:GspH/FimT family pseudopilin [Nocardioides bruguierae]MCM0622373.1 GspH/FimT family pseudopilin [Nocardioides bruguierae]
MTQPTDPRDRGFTLVELMATVTVLTIVLGIAISGWVQWTRANAQEGTAEQVQAALRATQQRAVTEGRSLCVMFTDADYQLFSGRCADDDRTALQEPVALDGQGTHLLDPAFTTDDDGTLPGVTFSSRGTATAGTVTVVRDDSDREIVIHVEGLTGRVSRR